MDWIAYPILAAALVVAALAGVARKRRNRADAARSLDGTLAACRSLLALTGHLQQHRGMSSAWLSGDRGFGPKLDAKAREIDTVSKSLRAIAESESGKPHPCLTVNDLQLFLHRWAGLREKLPGLTVEQSIAQHSFLIEQLLQWLAALGEARVEPLVADRGARGVVRNYASRLPRLTECLGQTRAVGLCVATRQGCSAVARVRLMFLVARAEALLNQAAESGARSVRGERAADAVRQMARLVRTRMLVSSGISVSAQEYFDVATRAVDGVFDWISETGDQLASDRLPAGGDRFPTHVQPV